MVKHLIALSFCLYAFQALSTDVVQVKINLTDCQDSKLKIIVQPPKFQKEKVHFVVPKIIPGTYMRVNFIKVFDDFIAFDSLGNTLPLKKKDNHVIISNAQQIDRLEYYVEQSDGNRPIWDNAIGCDGTIFDPGVSFILNYQLMLGYFEGHMDWPIEVEYTKPAHLYGASGLEKSTVSPTKDIFRAKNYSELIDSPLLYSKADTASIKIGAAQFRIASYSRTGKVTSEFLKPKIEEIMLGLNDFMGDLPSKNYDFLFYYQSRDSIKGLSSKIGLNSALEHLNSSMYYMSEPENISYLSVEHIIAHEYLHTWAPLNIHSEKIDQFNYDEPDMSKHLWLYEGVTDYLATLALQRYELKNSWSFWYSLEGAIDQAEKRKRRSMTESSEDIISGSAFSWLGKALQMIDFYFKGNLVAFCMDAKLMEVTEGKVRLNDVIQNLSKTYKDDIPFSEDDFFDEFVRHSHPSMREFLNNYIVGDQLPDYQYYLEKFGWYAILRKEKVPTYGKIYARYLSDEKGSLVVKANKNTIGIEKGDTLIFMDNKPFNMEMYNSGYINKMLRPNANDNISIVVIRNGEKITLNGVADKMAKLKWAQIRDLDNITTEQLDRRKRFLYGDLSGSNTKVEN